MKAVSLLSDARLAASLKAALRRGVLPEAFLYQSPSSVQAWLRLCGKGAYRNYRRSLALVRRAAAPAAAAVPPGEVAVVSLGAGQGDKDLILLKALARAGRTPAYFPVDASRPLLRLALARAAGRFPARAIRADFADRRLARLMPPRAARLVLLLGNTLGCDPRGLAAAAARLVRPGDLLIVDGEISGPGTLAGYDNPVNRTFAWAPLRRLGLSDADGDLRFGLRRLAGGLARVEKSFHPRRAVRLKAAGGTVPLRGVLRMSPSYKFSEAALLGVLRRAGLAPLRVFAGERFRLVLAGSSWQAA